MEITLLQIGTSSYRTTNPPVSQSQTLTVCKQAVPFGAPCFVFRTEECFNGSERKAEHPLTAAQFDEIVGLFERLRLVELLFARLNETPAPAFLPPMAGGSSRTVLSFTANGVTVTASDPPQEMFERLQELRNTFADGEPPLPHPPGAPIFGAAPAPVPPPIPKTKEPADGWFCPNCGQKNTGTFCSECGQKR